jgi:predicted nuclease of predicted toxin-antitoxin system
VSGPSFLVDECLPFEVTQALRGRGFDTTDVFERGIRGVDDTAVWALAAAENRVLVTRDLDFPLRLPGPRPSGLLLLSAPNEMTASQLAALIEVFLDAVDAGAIVGHIVVLSPGRYRRRAW